MKDQINRLARGEFSYETPTLAISETNISVNIPRDNIYRNEFNMIASSEVKGIVYSTDNRVTVKNSNFIGVENIMSYTVDTNGVESDQTIVGSFHIVSNSTEISIPYSFKVIEKTIHTSMGDVHNLFHFTNLAQLSPEEAQRLFVSEDFSTIFLKNDLNLINIYTLLNKGQDIQNNIEEFLIAVRKKSCITLSLSQDKKVYTGYTENFKDVVSVKKSTWGYIKLDITSDSDFIVLTTDRESLTSDTFTGNKFELEYILDKAKMHCGKNFGRITISCAYQTLIYEIEVDNYSIDIVHNKNTEKDINSKESDRKEINSKEKKKAIQELSRKYIDFRTKKIDVNSWIEGSNKILNKIRGIDDRDIYFKLAQAQVYFSQQRIESAEWLLHSIREEILQQKQSDIPLYCYYLYVDSLIKKDNEYSLEMLKTIKKYYENGHDDWQILWIMFYIDDEYDKNKSIKLARIKEQYHKGCKSPILYLEACNIINAQPMLLRVLNDFELQVINFACKNKYINDKMAYQICELCKHEKSVSKTYLRILKKVYDTFENDEMLNVLCTNLIRNEISGPRVFNLYEKCILKNFRITRLYEFYIESIDSTKMTALPKIVLLYFSYNNQLNYEKKAFLYANIITNKETDTETYLNYRKQIELFAFEQLRKQRISENLLIIYNDIWNKSLLNEDSAEIISKILFTHKLICGNDNMKNVIVKQKESQEEIMVPLVDHVAYVQLYTENYSIVFEDEDKVRKKDSISFKLKKIFDKLSYIQMLYDINHYDLYLLLYLCERNCKYKKRTADNMIIHNYLLNCHGVTPEFKNELRNSIINYYHIEYIGDNFKYLFSEINTQNLSEIEATKLIETCIMNGMYQDAYDLALLYGYRKVNPKRLFKMCRMMIEITDYNHNEFILGMCHYVFLGKKYDDVILEYLVSYFNGNSTEMFEICEACFSFEVEAYELEERFIALMIFINSNDSRLDLIYEKYKERGPKERVEEAYLAYRSYCYFVKNNEVDENLFFTLQNKMLHGEELILVCEIAILMYYSKLKHLEEKQQVLAKKLLDKLCSENKIFKFFSDLKEHLELPYIIMDKTIVEYRSNPEDKVMINFLISEHEKTEDHKKNHLYLKEIMKNTFEGIFTKKFTLLYGESLDYYFTVVSKGVERKTENKRIICNNMNPSTTNGRFDYINDMLASKELHDVATLRKLMHGYCVQDYITEQLFKPF